MVVHLTLNLGKKSLVFWNINGTQIKIIVFNLNMMSISLTNYQNMSKSTFSADSYSVTF